ncbi:MAG TPA: DUF4412 domain-containing protein [Polyangiaceae bacterium]
MKKLALILALTLPLACSKDKTDSAATSAASASASATTATTAATPSLLDKALSFVTGGPFEGEITMQMTDEGRPPRTMLYAVKGNKMRFDVPGRGAEGDSYAIMDGDTKKMVTVTDSKKMAFEMDMNAAGNPMAAAAAANAAAKPNVEKTGKTDTVAGYSCEEWKITEPNGDKTDLCAAKGISFPSMGRSAPSWAGELGEGFFPLRVVTTDSAGKEKSKMEVTKIEKKTEDASRFEVPAGYKTMNMGDMMKGLGGMHGLHGMPH